MKIRKKKIITKILLGSIIGLIIILVSLFIYMINYTNPQNQVLEEYGIIEKQTQVGDITFNYAEGPDNGPPLVLLHAQLLDWFTYNQVLPELSQHFHVYAIDYIGHGKTRYPENYVMNAHNIGGDIASFIDQVIGQPVFITGNSSGGLLTTWIAANRPDLVSAIVLEDPPLFSAEYPEIQKTIAYKSFTTSYQAQSENYSGEFLDYWIDNSSQFFKTYTGPFSQQIIDFTVTSYKHFNPDAPVDLPFIPVSVKEMLRGLNYYDPSFGTAFYLGTWNEDFNHQEALSKIECPVLLLHANYAFTEDGILNGAMSQDMADKAISHLDQGQYLHIDAGHVINLEEPELFAGILYDFFIKNRIDD